MNFQFALDQLTAELTDILTAYPELSEDDDLKADVLEGETTLHELMERVFAVECAAKGMVAAIAERQADLAARKKRFNDRIDAMRKLMRVILKRAELNKLELPEFTVSLRAGSISVHIDDEDAVPRQLCKVKYTPDKTAIRKALDQNEIVPGAVLVTGEESVTVRTK